MEISERGARFLLALMAVLGVVVLLVVLPLVTYVVLGLIAAFVLRTPYNWLLRRVKKPQVAAGLMVFLSLAVIVAPLVFVIATVVDDAAALASGLASGALQDDIEALLRSVGVPARVAEDATGAIGSRLQAFAVEELQTLLPNLFWVFIGLFVFFFLQFYGFTKGEAILAFVRETVPLRPRRMNRLLEESARSVDAVFRGELLVALVQGLLAGVGWWLFGFPNPLFWGFVMTILSIIPWTGAPLVIVPVGLYTAAVGDWPRGLGFAAFGVLLVGMVDNVLRPFVIGRQGAIHPAIVLVGVVGGLAAFGIVGIFVGPLAIVLLRAVILVWNDAEIVPNSTP